MNKINKKLKLLSDTPGVYRFYNKKKELIYVGKATSLRDRVRSYFRANSQQPIANRRTKVTVDSGSGAGMTAVARRPIEVMIGEVVDIKTTQTDSVLEAVILEGNLIKKFRPKYNIDWKDDKSWNYIVITGDEFPRVITLRERELKIKNYKIKNSFGPYPGLNAKATMKILRRIFKFSECRPASLPHPRPLLGKEREPRPCFYYQMGECLGVCTGEISSSQYKQKVIRPLIMFLSGNKKGLLKSLNVKMKLAARTHNFEEAGRLRDQIKALQRIQDVAMLNEGFVSKSSNCHPERSPQGGVEGSIRTDKDSSTEFTPTNVGAQNDSTVRIEGYDISNLGASDKVGSMVVFDNDGPVKSEYRKFNIKTVAGQSDVDCLREVLQRRLKHKEWPLPDVFLIDGGLPQVNAARQTLIDSSTAAGAFAQNDKEMPVVAGIAKGVERKRNDFIIANGQNNPLILEWIKTHQKLLIQVRDEAHRFAIAFNRSKRRQWLTS